MTIKTFTVAPEVVSTAADKVGLYGQSAEAVIKMMARSAEKVTHPSATHRFQQYIMTIDENGQVTNLDIESTQQAVDLGKRVYDKPTDPKK